MRICHCQTFLGVISNFRVAIYVGIFDDDLQVDPDSHFALILTPITNLCILKSVVE